MNKRTSEIRRSTLSLEENVEGERVSLSRGNSKTFLSWRQTCLGNESWF